MADKYITTDNVRRAKVKLEEKMLKLINEFMEETECLVTSIGVEVIQHQHFRKVDNIHVVKLDVRVEI